jgi:ATP-binding protein involved in chromosome partitioning
MSLSKEAILEKIGNISVPPEMKPLREFISLENILIDEKEVVRIQIQLEGASAKIRGVIEDSIYSAVPELDEDHLMVKFQAKQIVATPPTIKRPDGKIGLPMAGGGGAPAASAGGHSHGAAPKPQAALPQTGQPIPGVKNIIAVASGKGGVGKSTVAVNLALALQKRGDKVGLLDIDIYGPSLQLLLGVHDRPSATPEGKIAPIEAHGMKLMSLGFISGDDTPMIWRGPMVMGVVSQFLHEVDWSPLDYLVIDLPPGTGDAQLTLVQKVPVTVAIIVTTPSDLALIDAKKGLQMFRKTDVPVLGIIENMSYFIAPDTGKRYDIFGHGGGRQSADDMGTPFLGEIPIDLEIRSGGDEGKPIVLAKPDSTSAKPFFDLADRVRATLGKKTEEEGAKKKSFLGRIFGR